MPSPHSLSAPRQGALTTVITLGEMRAKGMTMLEVACHRCERRGRLRIAWLIAEHGAGVLDGAPLLRQTVRGVVP